MTVPANTEWLRLSLQRIANGGALIASSPGRFAVGPVLINGVLSWSVERPYGGTLTPLWPRTERTTKGGPITDAERKSAGTIEDVAILKLGRWKRSPTVGLAFPSAKVGAVVVGDHVSVFLPGWQFTMGPPAEWPSRKVIDGKARWAFGLWSLTRLS